MKSYDINTCQARSLGRARTQYGRRGAGAASLGEGPTQRADRRAGHADESKAAENQCNLAEFVHLGIHSHLVDGSTQTVAYSFIYGIIWVI